MRVAFIYSDGYGLFDYGSSHPLRITRLSLTVALMKEYGLFDHPDLDLVEARPASREELQGFHTPEYVAALIQANRGDFRPGLMLFGLGPGDNPVFRGVYDWSALLAGASLQAGLAVADGRAAVAFNIAGGMHHARSSHASGFCYVNDPVLTIRQLLARGSRVAYVDIDAHHGDGVQEAFYDTDAVLTISLHQNGKTLFPGTGFVSEQGAGRGKGFSVNLPLLPETDDVVYQWAFDQVVPPLVRAFAPDVLVTQLGADGLYEDPLANLHLTDMVFAHACRVFRELSGRWVALGGGGYHEVNVARCWTIALAQMLGVELPQELPSRFLGLIKTLEPDRLSLRDGVSKVTGSAGLRAEAEARRVVERIQEEIFPVHGL